MSLYIIKDTTGNVYGLDGEFDNLVINATLYDEPIEAERDANEYGGHVVELVEKPEPVKVNQEEAEMLTEAKTATYPAEYITRHSCLKQGLQDRLLRAYVNGWTVEKPKRYLIKVPHTTDELYWKRGNGNIGCAGAWQNDDEIIRNRAFTLSEIEHYGLGECEKEGVTDDE